jgi:DNA polymerase/3'-5' exonuclease PolX
VSTGVRVPYSSAIHYAQRVAVILWDSCERIEVAGSLRRQRPDAGDIELVAVPRFRGEADGLWGSTRVNVLTETVDRLIVSGALASHPTDPKRGDRYSKLVEPQSGLQVDLFSATPESFGMVLLIRTGPADYSHRFVTDLRRRGLHAARGQLHRGGLGCGEYECEVVPTPEEADVYAAAGWPFVQPGMRA